jgi:hypothetical protein
MSALIGVDAFEVGHVLHHAVVEQDSIATEDVASSVIDCDYPVNLLGTSLYLTALLLLYALQNDRAAPRSRRCSVYD